MMIRLKSDKHRAIVAAWADDPNVTFHFAVQMDDGHWRGLGVQQSGIKWEDWMVDDNVIEKFKAFMDAMDDMATPWRNKDEDSV